MSDTFLQHSFLAHHGILGMKWGIRRYQNKDGSLTSAGRARYGSGKKVFVSGSSKTQDKNSGYYRKNLPDTVRRAIDSKMKNGDTILVGDAPGIDRQVQDYLKKNKYKHVTVYATGDSPRYSANKKWDTKLVDSKGYEPGTPEFNRQKDIAMSKDADSGIAVVLNKGGAKATRDNVERLIEQNKDVDIFQLSDSGLQYKISYERMKKPEYGTPEYDSFIKKNAEVLNKGLKKMSDIKMYNDMSAMKDPKTKREWRDAADLGLKVYENNGELDLQNISDKERNSLRNWFIYEDQTIGKPEIAAMVNRGYKNEEIKNLLNIARDSGSVYDDVDINNEFGKAFRFGASEGYNLEDFVDGCFNAKKQKH